MRLSGDPITVQSVPVSAARKDKTKRNSRTEETTILQQQQQQQQQCVLHPKKQQSRTPTHTHTQARKTHSLLPWAQTNSPGVKIKEGRKQSSQQSLSLFCLNSPVGDDLDEVVGRERVLDGDRKRDRVLLVGVPLLQQEGLVVQDLLAVHVLHQDPEQHRVVVDLRGGGQNTAGEASDENRSKRRSF